MGLDISTPKGQVSLRDEQIVARWFNRKEGHVYAQTPKHSPAKIDAALIKHGNLIGLAETKCRYDVTLSKFRTKYDNKWLVTWEKVESGLGLAEQLCVPFWGFLYLVDDDTLLIQNLTQATLETAFTETQETINGGKITRENAYISMENAIVRYNISK
jgi:hypothetical protein